MTFSRNPSYVGVMTKHSVTHDDLDEQEIDVDLVITQIAERFPQLSCEFDHTGGNCGTLFIRGALDARGVAQTIVVGPGTYSARTLDLDDIDGDVGMSLDQYDADGNEFDGFTGLCREHLDTYCTRDGLLITLDEMIATIAETRNLNDGCDCEDTARHHEHCVIVR